MSDHFLRNAMEAHGDTVYRLALCRTQNAADAEDVYQDVFLRLLGQEERDWDGEHLKAWLIRVAINTCHSHFRGRREIPVEQLPEQGEAAPETPVLDEVRLLPEKYRNAIYLHYYEGYTAKEIAGILHTRQNTVLSWLQRGRELLRRQMTGGFEDE